ncbi:SCP2 sterol-binding domain-containing protein [Paracoccus alkenifer]|uniref:SCP-2 sterol transfer family protein n=1 Tax=Paracoccus alkenifer TaxID=65735 RepID=A0A1H6LCM2_9RHOB|nr:SCP2 sterol-binding domain-containing protein [Paracoccus alkenifer]SEH82388.1 SCP-2 sterol transfer family protein [Paracoccus alkenifer]
MSSVIEGAIKVLAERLSSFDGTAKFVIEDVGTIMIDESGVRAGDGEAEVTLTASRDTFEGLFNGETNPTMAYMTGKLKIDGSLPTAMKLGTALS